MPDVITPKPPMEMPDLRSQFIAELAEKIVYWRAFRNVDADKYALGYERLLHAVLTPNITS